MIRIEESQGVNITSGIINAALAVVGERTNRIAGNYIIPADFSVELSPSTVVEANFTKDGPWEKNCK